MHAGTNYIETLRMQIHANCRIRRVYFSDRLYTEEELPTEFKYALHAALATSHTPTPSHTAVRQRTLHSEHVSVFLHHRRSSQQDFRRVTADDSMIGT